jgi:hypothetical protein
MPDQAQIDIDIILGLPDHETWILEAPLNIRNHEMRLRRAVSAIDMNLHRNGHIVGRTKKGEDSTDLNR